MVAPSRRLMRPASFLVFVVSRPGAFGDFGKEGLFRPLHLQRQFGVDMSAQKSDRARRVAARGGAGAPLEKIGDLAIEPVRLRGGLVRARPRQGPAAKAPPAPRRARRPRTALARP